MQMSCPPLSAKFRVVNYLVCCCLCCRCILAQNLSLIVMIVILTVAHVLRHKITEEKFSNNPQSFVEFFFLSFRSAADHNLACMSCVCARACVSDADP